MKKGEFLNGYLVLEDFKVIGGQSKISFVSKDGVEYFIKEFLSPKYPTPDAPGSEKVKSLKKQKCKVFEELQEGINSKISEKVSYGGNLIYALDFFRVGTTYYKINEKINMLSITPEGIFKLSLEEKVLICKTVCHSLKILHSVHIVHADIKPDNILIKKTKTGSYTTKMIDFDSSFFSKAPPKNTEEVVGDQVYYAPEMAQYIQESDTVTATDLTTKIDVFALGVLFVQYFTGILPQIDDAYDYSWQPLIAGDKLRVDFPKDVPERLKELLLKMLDFDYQLRPDINDVFQTLKSYKRLSSGSLEEHETSKLGLRGSLLKSSTSKTTIATARSKPKLKGSLIGKGKK